MAETKKSFHCHSGEMPFAYRKINLGKGIDMNRFGRRSLILATSAFATLSAAVSLVAHAPEHTGEETKLARAIRAYIARRRKKVVAIRQIPGPERIVEVEREVVREVPVRQTIIKHIPVDFRSGRHLALPEREIVANGLNPIVSKLVGEAK